MHVDVTLAVSMYTVVTLPRKTHLSCTRHVLRTHIQPCPSTETPPVEIWLVLGSVDLLAASVAGRGPGR